MIVNTNSEKYILENDQNINVSNKNGMVSKMEGFWSYCFFLGGNSKKI